LKGDGVESNYFADPLPAFHLSSPNIWLSDKSVFSPSILYSSESRSMVAQM
jgi:hypothetical protein